MANTEIKLTIEQKTTLTNLSADMTFLEGELSRAERAGIDISELKADFTKMKKLRAGLLKEYGG